VTAQNDLEQGKRAGGKASLVKSSVKKSEGLLQHLALRLEERYSVKMLIRIWGPRLEFVVRLMLVATYFDDSFRTATNFSDHVKQVGEQGCLSRLAATSPEFAGLIATVALGIGLLAQALGSLCVLSLRYSDGATKALISWTIVQPILYAQLSNAVFVAESLSLVGGLLMLRAHLVIEQAKLGAGARTQLFGRLLIPAMYVYYVWVFLLSALSLDETNDLATYISSMSIFVVNMAALVCLVIGTTLVAFGLKSRLIALLLAIVNLGYVFCQHPFFRFVWLENGEWKYDEHKMYSHIALPTNVSMGDFDEDDPSVIYDLQRYYFFLGLSTSGALLLLAQFGPGEMAVQKTEVLLPLVRAKD
jgi:uncharacterized membrane protein YphA (DoxX/SURF4 family)